MGERERESLHLQVSTENKGSVAEVLETKKHKIELYHLKMLIKEKIPMRNETKDCPQTKHENNRREKITLVKGRKIHAFIEN